MVFKQSEESKAVDELMEAKAFYDNFLIDSERIINFIHRNMDLDYKNDFVRSEVTQHLVSALTAANMRSFEDVNKHINAAIQKLHSQEAIDLKDDKPRTDALLEISKIREKAIRNSERLRDLTAKVDSKRKGNSNDAKSKLSES